MPEAPKYEDFDAVKSAYRKGDLTKDQAREIITTSGFMTPGDPMTDPNAYEKQMRETVKREDAQRAKEEAEGPGFWDRIANALYRGYQGYQQTEIDQYGDPDKSDFADIATSAAIQENLPMGKGLQEFYQSEGFGEAVKNLFAHDYGGTLLELVAESMGSYIPSVVERAPARVAAGAAIGAGVGATALGAGAAPGALTGASWGLTASFGDAALALEYSNIILSGLKEQGVDVTNAKALEDGFSDPKVMGDLRTKAIKGGIPVALFDMFTARLGGRFLAGAKKKGTSKAVAGAKEFVTQGAGGAAGEISKSLVLDEEISAPGVVGEIFGEGPTSVLEIGVGYMEKTKGIDVPQPKLPDNMEGNWRTVDSFEVEESVDAETSLDEVLDQVEKPLPDVEQKEAEVNQAQAESVETTPEPTPAPSKKEEEVKQEEAKQDDASAPDPKEDAPDVVSALPDPTPEQQEQAAKEDVQRATEQAAEQPDIDSMPQNQDTFNALHKYARLAKKQGKTLEQWAGENGLEMSDAVVAAWDDADNETPTTLDMLPPEVNAALGNNNLRNRAAKFANADISDKVLGGVSNVGYEKRSNETDAEYAQRDIEEKGLDAATTTALDTGDNMPAPAKTVYQAEVLQALRNDEKDAQAAGDQARTDQRVDQQIALMERINEASTNAGQFLQAFSHFSRLSVGGMLKYAGRAFEKIAGKKVKDAQDAFRRVRDTLRDTEEQVVNEVINETQDKLIGSDPKVKDATRKQVGELVAKEEKPETSEIVRKHYEKPDNTPLAQKLEGSGMDSKTAAREGRRIEAKYKRTHAKVTGEVKKRMKQILKKMPLWKRYKNEIVAALTRAVNPATKKNASAPLQKFSQRLSNNLRKQMKSLRPERQGSIDKLTDEQVLAEGISNLEKYEQVWLETQQELREQDNLTPEQIAQLDQVFKDGTPMPFAASTMDRAIRSAMVRLEQNLDKVVRQNREGQNEARTKVIDDIIARTGLVGKEAELLSDMLNKRYNELATKRKKAALNKLNRTDGKVIPAAIKSKYQKIIEWSNLGAFSDSKFDEELAKRLDIPVMTDALKKRIVEKARVIESKPEGFQKQREAIKLMNFLKGQQNFGLADLFWDFWFANVLSGLSTQTINLLGSTMNLMAHTITQFIRKPGDLGVMIKGLARGMRKGLSEGREVLESGLITGTRLEKFEQARNLELIEKFRGGKFNPLSYLKFVGRGLAAGDMLFFKTAEEMRAAVIARNVAKEKNLKGRALARATNEILNNTAAAREKATIQADKEGLKGLDRRRRIAELMEEGRPQPEEAKEYALRVIYSNKPYGVLGIIAERVNQLNAQIPLFRVFAPFVNIVSNVTNESLNYFPPVGYARSRQAKRKGELYGKPLSEDSNTRKDQMGDQFAKSTLGMVAMTAVGGLAWSMKDDEDPWFMVYGTGPRDYGKNKTWRATGALPYSIKINDTYIPYKDTVMAIPFAVIGSFLDGHRYNGAQDDELMSRLALSLTYTAGVITENSFLKGIQAAAAGINQKMSGDTATKVISQQASRTITGAVVPFGGLLRDIDRLNDPTRYDGIDIETMLYSQIPFVRRVNKPTLNVLGEPVEMHVSDRYWSTPRASEELRYLVERGAFPSFPNKNSTVNLFGRDMEPDEFYDYIKMSGEQIRARIKTEIYGQRQLYDQLPSEMVKLQVDKIVKEERSKAKSKLFARYPSTP
jgi:hypothetical protein